MTGEAALYRLMTWLTPSFPVGAFSYSHGLEWPIDQGEIRDAAGMRAWIAALLQFGSGRNDAILCAAGWRAAVDEDWAELCQLSELALALSPSAERLLETCQQGRAFAATIAASWPCAGIAQLVATNEREIAYPVAVGAAAAGHAIPLAATLGAYLHAFTANLVSVGLRLIPLGQTDGQRLLAALEPVVAAAAAEAAQSNVDDLGSASMLADIASMNHETQYSRLFRS